ncbi:MAG: acyl carrier protein [Alphaproteobacteria bacterium]
MRETFENDVLEVRADMTAEDIEGWDSLSHIRLIVALEREFGIRFTAAEVSGLANVGDLIACISRKLSG